MALDYIDLVIVGRVSGAIVIGALIGFERTFHGRPAGFRTHALVCLASTLLMIVTVYQGEWMTKVEHDAIRTDPTRMAQGIMTGIGFLGAGVIFKEGLSVRGLTTAASIWITAAIGIMIGIGFYMPAIAATLMTIAALTLFRWLEERLPSHSYAQHVLCFARSDVMPEAEVKKLLKDHHFKVVNLSYRTGDNGETFEYRMVIRTTHERNFSALAASLLHLPRVRSFRISPAGN